MSSTSKQSSSNSKKKGKGKAKAVVDSDDDVSIDESIFAGCWFYLHCSHPGITKTGVRRLIEEGGGEVVDDVEHRKLTHLILNGQVWCAAFLLSFLSFVLTVRRRRTGRDKAARASISGCDTSSLAMRKRERRTTRTTVCVAVFPTLPTLMLQY